MVNAGKVSRIGYEIDTFAKRLLLNISITIGSSNLSDFSGAKSPIKQNLRTMYLPLRT